MAEEVPLKAYHLQGSLHQRKDASKGAVGLKTILAMTPHSSELWYFLVQNIHMEPCRGTAA